MPFTFDVLLASGWHFTVFVSWATLAVIALVILAAVGANSARDRRVISVMGLFERWWKCVAGAI